MLNDLFGVIIGLEEEVKLGLKLQFDVIDDYESGLLSWDDVKETERKRKSDMADLKEVCHKFFQANLTSGELLNEDSELSQQWKRVEGIVKDIFPIGTLERICCK